MLKVLLCQLYIMKLLISKNHINVSNFFFYIAFIIFQHPQNLNC